MDLNRNYSYKWNNSRQGGSNRKCRTDYRGPKSFSEPETQAIKKLIEGDPFISSCLNFHAWGNLWIHPYSYTSDQSNSK